MQKRKINKFLTKRNAEQGSVGGAFVVALGALGLVGFYLSNTVTNTQSQIKAARGRTFQEAAVNGGISNFAVFKSLMTPMLTDTGPATAREPFLYAADYFAQNWSLNQNTVHFNTTDLAVPGVGQTISLKSARSPLITLEGAAAIFRGDNHQTNSDNPSNFTHSTVKIVKANISPTSPFYRESVVISASDTVQVVENGQTLTKQTTPIFAEIHLPAPRPSDVKLYAVKIGDEANPIDLMKSGLGTASAPLAAGTYKFQLATAGVALNGVIEINGVPLPLGVVGDHKFNNIMAPLGIIGETQPIRLGNIATTTISTTSSAAGTTLGQTVTRAADGCGFDVNDNQSVTYGGASGASSSITTVDSGANQVKISAWVNRVDMTNTMDEYPIDLIVYASDGSNSVAGTSTVQNTAPLTVAPMCADKCNNISETMVRSNLPSDHQAYYAWMDDTLTNPDPTYNDVLASEATANKQQQLNQPGFNLKGRICLSRDAMAKKIFDTFGLPPSKAEKQRTDEYYAMLPDGKNWYQEVAEPLERYVYYAQPTCERTGIGARGSKCGCFAADTRIQMANGELKPASEIRQGDLVWNPKSHKSQAVKEVIAGPEKIPMIEVKTASRSLTITNGHPFLTKKGLIQAKTLRMGDILIDGSEETVVTSVTPVSHYNGEQEPEVWNFVLEGSDDADDHYVNANGVMTGDLFLQRELAQEAE
ncbi:MAG: hypothetical protein H7249_03525 [Chitinophagaceae bacterium]|nr:hypothetical protein [Oligoflexus sp.]